MICTANNDILIVINEYHTFVHVYCCSDKTRADKDRIKDIQASDFCFFTIRD